MLVWEEYDGPRKWTLEFGRIAHAIQSNVESPFHHRNQVVDFCTEHFGKQGNRWWFTTEAREFNKGRVKNSRYILCFGTEADMVFFLTGCER